MQPEVVLCKKCGFFRGNVYDNPKCPICGIPLHDAGISFREFSEIGIENCSAYLKEHYGIVDENLDFTLVEAREAFYQERNEMAEQIVNGTWKLCTDSKFI